MRHPRKNVGRERKGVQVECWVPPTFGIWAKEEEKPSLMQKANLQFVGSTKVKREESIEEEGVVNSVECPFTCTKTASTIFGQKKAPVTLISPHHMCIYTHMVMLTKFPVLTNLKCHPQVHPSLCPPHLQYLVSQLLSSECRRHLESGPEQRIHAGQSTDPAPLQSSPLPTCPLRTDLQGDTVVWKLLFYINLHDEVSSLGQLGGGVK